MGGLGLLPGHGRSLLSFTQVVLIKKRIILELQRLPLCLGPGSPADGWLGWGTAGGQGSTPDSLVRAPLQVFTPTGRASPEGPREGAVWSRSGPRSVPKSFQRSLPRRVRGQADPAVTAAFDPRAQERGWASPAGVSGQLPVGSPRIWGQVFQGGVFPQEPSRGSERPRLPAVDTGPSSPVRGASRLWNPHPPAPCSGSVLPTPACLVPPHRRNFQPHCQVGCLILDGHLGDLTAHP